jgi:phosphoserine phosphatase RsbU/P
MRNRNSGPTGEVWKGVNVMTASAGCALIDQLCLDADPAVRFRLSDLTPDERRTLETDLTMAARIQQAQLPSKDFSYAGLEIDYHYSPASLVSGDYYDLFESNEGLLFLLGDVSGKGVASAMLASHLRAIFRSLAGCPLDEMVETANRVFCQSALAGQFATLIAGCLTRSGSVNFISAGHLPFLHLSSVGVRAQRSTEVPLGMLSGAGLTIHRLFLDIGDSLLVYTDGLTEARDPAGEQYGLQRVQNLAVRHRGMAPSDLVVEYLSDLLNFTEGAKQTDDLTLLAIRRTP